MGQDDFAARLALLVRRRGLSPEKYARLIDVSMTSVNRWIKRERSPGLNHLLKICTVEGVSMDWLTGHKRSAGGISLDRVETILRRIDEHETWGKYDSTEKLKILAAIYESSKEGNLAKDTAKLVTSRRG